MLLSFRISIVFDFTLILARICFNVFGLEPSKNLCLNLARMAQSFKRCFTVTA